MIDRPALNRLLVLTADGVEAHVSESGRIWPKPEFVKTKPGDIVIVKHETPHSGTRIDGPDPRFMIYFRVIHSARPGNYTSNLCHCL